MEALGGEAHVALRLALVVWEAGGARIVSMRPGVELVVGREEPADVVVPDPRLSRRHASFEIVGDVVVVRDLGSKNGLFVQGERVEEATLRAGDACRLGGVAVSISSVPGGTEADRDLLPHERMLASLHDELVRARHFGRPFAVVSATLHGPDEAGIAPTWRALRSALRAVDRIGAYAPRSVLIALPEADAAQAKRLVGAFAPPSPSLLVTFGIAEFPAAGTSVDALITAAREAGRRATAQRRVQIAHDDAHAVTSEPNAIVAQSPRLTSILATLPRIAATTAPVLVLGETGTGKELVARRIHALSARANRTMRAVNCGAMPATLLESMLFGHERGAFTGAQTQRAGLFEEANGGTVFLDELGELPLPAQAALLRVLEHKTVERLGGSTPIHVDVRLVAATNRDLSAMVAEGKFRLDLLHRLNTFVIELPPLRERPEDLIALASRLLVEASLANGRTVSGFQPEAIELMLEYPWPGNVRELRNVIERAALLAPGDRIRAEDLAERLSAGDASRASLLPPPPASPARTSSPPRPVRASLPAEGPMDLRAALRDVEVELILEALRRSNGNQSQAAALLQIPRRTLLYRMATLGIRRTYEADR